MDSTELVYDRVCRSLGFEITDLNIKKRKGKIFVEIKVGKEIKQPIPVNAELVCSVKELNDKCAV